MAEVKFADVVKRVNIKVDRFNTDRLYYVGGEHIDSNELVVSNRGLIEGSIIGDKFHFGCNKGHILFMSRNPHLRKAGMLQYDGVCSDSTYVVETRDENILSQRYLAIVMQSDHFWAWAEENKSGGVNFLINYGTLEEYEFDLPPIEKQCEIADLVWAAYDAKVAYKKMIEATDEILYAKFVEMFDIESNNNNFPIRRINDIYELNMGKTPARANTAYWNSQGHKWISISDMSNYDIYTSETSEKISDTAVSESGIKIIPKNTLIMSFKLSIGRCAITSEDIYSNEAIMAFTDKKTCALDILFMRYMFAHKNWLKGAILAVKGNTLNKQTIGSSEVIVPPINLQQDFVSLLQKSEASKNKMKESISNIESFIKGITNQFNQ